MPVIDLKTTTTPPPVISLCRTTTLVAIVAFCLTTAGTQAQDDRFTPKVADSNWKKDDAATAQVMQSAAMLRAKLLEDPHRPTYHFCMPEGGAGDPNGCFYADGRYHFLYLHNPFGLGATWGHASSHDLVHWRHHPDAIPPGPDDEFGAYSGGAFVDEDGTAYLSYWLKPGSEGKGVGIAKSTDPEFNKWVKLQPNPLIKANHRGYFDHTDAERQASLLRYGRSHKYLEKRREILYGHGEQVPGSRLWREERQADSPARRSAGVPRRSPLSFRIK